MFIKVALLLNKIISHSGTWILLAAVIGLLSTVAGLPMLTTLYIPMLVASIASTDWKCPLAVGSIAIGVQIMIWSFLREGVVDHSVYLLMVGSTMLVAIWICVSFSVEKTARVKLEEKLQNRSDKYLMRAHEIRTPLALIRASVELILDGAPGPITDQQQIFLENIDENSQHIALLAENMLTKGKLESGIFRPTFQPTDIRDPIRAVVADMRTFTERRQQTIRTYYPQMLPYVDVDPVLLRQAMLNLIQNAIRHTSPGGQIIVSVVENDHALLISVTDDGAGMTTEQRQQLFSRFASGSGGTGLGLLIVKQIVELSGGRVMVDTSLGRGTTFFFTLPFSTQNSTQNMTAERRK